MRYLWPRTLGVLTLRGGAAKPFAKGERWWLLIPEVDFIIIIGALIGLPLKAE